jgi:hypothetical protein
MSTTPLLRRREAANDPAHCTNGPIKQERPRKPTGHNADAKVGHDAHLVCTYSLAGNVPR